MPNSITLAKNYIALLDEVYKLASLTSVLDSNPADAK
nr:MAG TPA: Major capsid protein [Caudoviricetes sp.]